MAWVALFALVLAKRAEAQVIEAEPDTPIVAPFPEGAPPVEVQVTLHLLVDANGDVESAVPTTREPSDAPEAFATAAVTAAKEAKFHPSTRDGRAIRSKITYVIVFHPPHATEKPAPPRTPPPPSPPTSTNEQDEDYEKVVRVRGVGWSSPRGLGDIRVKRELLDAAPHQQTSEMLSAAPGFFVDHEDGEGIGNDVYLRGFDLDHGNGIEMRLGSIPINIPTHIQGQGYADANFIIPEVVRSIRVLEGPYDPRQGDAAIVGSAYFDLGVPERGYQAKATYGSFNQARVMALAAPREADDETFLAFAARKTDGFGENRASQSATAMGQYGFDLGLRDHLRLLATAYGARATLPGVVREDDVDAGRIGYYDSYPFYSGGQGVQSGRVVLGADFDHVAPSGARFEFAPWFMWTDFRARQNFAGNLESSQIDPMMAGLGDLFETTNLESAAGLTSRFHTAPWRIGDVLEVVAEPGIVVRLGHTDQTKSLLYPTNPPPSPTPPPPMAPPYPSLAAWDRRIDASLSTLDLAAYVDVDARLFKRLRIAGGVRADLIYESSDDRLANAVPAGVAPPGALPGTVTDVQGVAIGPRVTAQYDVTPELAPAFSYGVGFRSLDAASLTEGTSTPFSRVRSAELGLRAQAMKERYVTTLAAFETWVGNELVFEAEDGGMVTENASVRRGVVGSFVAKPTQWLLASTALSVNNAIFTTLVPGVSHYVPNIPAVLFRADVTARGRLGQLEGAPVTGRAGVGYTLLGGKHLTDSVIGQTNDVLNARAAVRYRFVELGLDMYNVLGLRYADDQEYYVSNWSLGRAQQPPPSYATHITAAPPRTVLGTIALYF
jgi:iron complex outermembrane recepter protein